MNADADKIEAQRIVLDRAIDEGGWLLAHLVGPDELARLLKLAEEKTKNEN